MTTKHLNRIYAAIAHSEPNLLLQNFVRVNNSNTSFRITASHGDNKNLNDENYDSMVATATDNKFKLIPGSVEFIGDQHGTMVISAIVEANVAVKAFVDEEVRAGYRSLAENVFIDDEDHIWKVVESNGQKQLVQSIKEDYAQLITSKVARKSSQIIAANFNGMVPNNGDYVQYYNTDNQSLQWGYSYLANDAINILDRVSKKPVAITASAVVEIVDGACLSAQFNMVEHYKKNNVVLSDDISSANLEGYLAYQRNLFGNTPYYDKLEKLVRARRNRIANVNIQPSMQNKLTFVKS